MRILSLTAGAGDDVLRQLPARQRAGGGADARGHDVTLLPVYTPTLTDEPNVSGSRVFFGGISVYLEQHVAALPPHAALLDRLWDAPRVHPARVAARRSRSTRSAGRA